MKSLSAITYILFLTAVLAWVGIVYTALSIRAEAAKRSEAATIAEQQSDRLAFNDRLRSLAEDTKAKREAIDRIAGADIVSIVGELENAAKSIRVAAQVSDALPEGSPRELSGGVRVDSVLFVVQGNGTFADLLHLAELYEHLPLPSSIVQLEIERNPDSFDAKQSWHLNARIRVLTTSTFSL